MSFTDIVARTQSARRRPVVDLSAAVVLDLSCSAVSSGERLYHPAAFSSLDAVFCPACMEEPG